MNALESPAFTDLDRHFARFIARFGGEEAVPLAAASLSRALRLGHSCLDLRAGPPPGEPALDVPWPPFEEWECELRRSKAVGGPEEEEPVTPLVLDAAGRLYLRRYFEYERALAAALRVRAAGNGGATGALEGQEAATETAVAGRLTLISGGPGTGKTTTVVKILARLLATPDLRVVLSAPTGKAAARLEEAVRDGLAKDPAWAAAPTPLPRAMTLDRLLGSRPDTTALRHHAENPLALDLLVVDEASMVDLPLMAKLFDALPADARVILLGDRDQLTSVGPGNLLADIAEAAAQPESPLHGALVMLKRNYRFGNDSAIFKLCEAVRKGDAPAALEIARTPMKDLGSRPLPLAAALHGPLKEAVVEGYKAYLAERDPARALEAFARFRILCAPRRGPYGVEALNQQTEALLREAHLLPGGQSRFYAGMPLLITRNDYQLNLFNGEVGILLPDPAAGGGKAGALWAWFPGETKDGASQPRRVSPARLPEHELAYAMTVHKSQGSEFERVLLILPERDLPLITRELIYTGLTRARKRVDLWFDTGVFERGVARRTQRASGLRERLAAPSIHLAQPLHP